MSVTLENVAGASAHPSMIAASYIWAARVAMSTCAFSVRMEARCFAVWFQLHPNQGFCHWVYAEPVGQGILFTDYQVDHPQLGGRPITGPLPLVGVLPNNSIATDVSTLVVIGFD